MSGKPKIDTSEWFERVEAAEEYWLKRLSSTDEIVRMYRCQDEQIGGVAFKHDRPEVNKVWEYVQAVLPQVFFKNPYAFVHPLKPGNQRKAEVLEAVLNAEVRKIPFTKHGRKWVLDALLRGWGVVKVGYMPPSLAYAITPTNKKDEEALSSTPNLRKSSVSDLSGRVLFFHVPPQNFFWDPVAADLEDASWCCHVTYEKLDSVKANKRYSNTEDIGASTLRSTVEAMRRASSSMLDPDFESWASRMEEDYVKLYEIWIRDGEHARRMLVLADSQGKDGKWLRWEEWPFTRMEDYPFVLLSFGPDPEGRLPGMSDVAPWLNLQQNLNGMLHRIVGFVDSMKAITLVDQEIAESVVREVAKGGDSAIIPVNTTAFGDKSKIKDSFWPVQHASLPPEIWTMWQQIQGLLHQVSGYTPYSMNEAKSAGTATEAGILERTSTLRIEDKLSNGVAEGIVQVFKRMLTVIQEFYEGGTVPILTPGGAKEFLRFQQEDLDVDATVAIDFGTMGRIVSDEGRARNLLLLVSQIGPMLANPQGVPAALREMIRRVMDAYHIVDAESLLPTMMPPVSPNEENIRLLMSEEAVQPTPQDDHELHMHVHQGGMQLAEGYGNQAAVQRIQKHMLMHDQMVQMSEQQGRLGGRSMGSASPPSGANPSAYGDQVPSPTGPGQTAGIQMPGGLR